MDALYAFAREAVRVKGEAKLGCPLRPPLVVQEDPVRYQVERDARVCECLGRLPLCEELERVEWDAKGRPRAGLARTLLRMTSMAMSSARYATSSMTPQNSARWIAAATSGHHGPSSESCPAKRILTGKL